ncbi:MAG: winged helix DNA-binding domain-containing protein, partial [Acidobacteria bacterium]|nr:winged helix DNA-binding domain-containing protein [Acidobacteriota bacterium]
LTTTLPIALGMLQVSGGIRRVPVNGRLDQQRYRYALWNMKSKLSPEQAMIQLACLYFEWLGPASVAGFQAFAGIGVRAAKAALEPLNLVPAGELLLLPGERDAFQDFEPPSQAQYALVSSLDSLVLHRRDLPSLIDSGLRDLPSHAIFDRGRLAGLWEFDPASGTIAWNAFSPPDTELRAAVAHTEAYVRDQLGAARSFSLDSPKSRQPRIQALREGAAG